MKILLIKMDHLGDVLWATPVVAALRQALPGAYLAFMVTPYAAAVVQDNPALNEIVTYEPKADFKTKWQILHKLTLQKFDQALVLGPVDKVNYLAYLSGAKKRIGYYYRGNPLTTLSRNFFLTKALPHPADTAQRQGKPLPHEVEAMGELLFHIGIAGDYAQKMQFFLNPAVKEEAEVMLYGKNNVMALHLCNKSFAWGWTEDNYVTLALNLLETFSQSNLLVSYGPRELQEGERLIARLPKHRIIKAGNLNLKLLGALLQKCRICLSWDTGIAHLASALGLPVVDLFPAKDYEYCVQRWGIWGGKHIYLVQEKAAPDETFVNSILEAVKKLL
jgi:ADP-heptose:LPS heptosyltransferase